MATDSANYSNWILTRKLAEVETQAAQSTDKIEWARMLASADTIPFENLANLNDNNLRTLSAKQTVQVSDVNVAGNTVTVTGVFDSEHNANEYLVNTIFLTARYRGVEFLAASCVARGQAMRMPRSTAEQYTTFTVKAQVILATTNSVSTRIDPTTPATNDRVDRIEEKIDRKLAQFLLDYNTLKTRVDVNDSKDRSQDTTLADHDRRISENARNLVREPRVAELISQARTALNQEISRVDGNATRNIQALDRRLTVLDSSNGRVKQVEDSVRRTESTLTERINNLKISGRNWLRDTSTTQTISCTHRTGYRIFELYRLVENQTLAQLGFKVGDTISVAFKYNVSQNGNQSLAFGSFRVELYDGGYKGLVGNLSSAHSGEYFGSLTLTSNHLNATQINLRVDDAYCTIHISECRLFKTDMFQDWGLPPEEIARKEDIVNNVQRNEIRDLVARNDLNPLITVIKQAFGASTTTTIGYGLEVKLYRYGTRVQLSVVSGECTISSGTISETEHFVSDLIPYGFRPQVRVDKLKIPYITRQFGNTGDYVVTGLNSFSGGGSSAVLHDKSVSFRFDSNGRVGWAMSEIYRGNHLKVSHFDIVWETSDTFPTNLSMAPNISI